jgi:phenylalanyl-tRNA synthetase beta chain
MKFTESWLRQWVNPKLDTNQLAEQLTMAGLEVDSVTKLADDFTGVVVGKIVECGKHPNADKLNICKVDIGSGDPYPIVCGGDNVRVGLNIALATVGAVLPGDFKIKKSKLRGEPSNGMICSSKELGIDDPNATPKGIMELRDDAPLGQDLREYLQLDDCIIDIELTPNRGDCASVKGVAREVGVLNQLPVKFVEIKPQSAVSKETFSVKVENSKACPRYAGRVISGINTAAQTPAWMVLRLEQCGIRCIHPVVDVCNYVMLELGQPMHGFDIEKLNGEVVVRAAHKGEKLKLLDEQEVMLQPTDLVVADKKAAQAVAGVMGGFDSGVTESTRHIFLESAFFDPVAISLTARRLGVVSDSSYRFERGVDYELQVPALERATSLLLEIVGGQPGPIVQVSDDKTLPETPKILLRRGRIAQVLGIEVKDAVVTQVLELLGMGVETQGMGWSVTVPSHRSDISLEVDLIEEVARIYGYNHIPTRNLTAPLIISTKQKSTEARIADLLVDRGYREVITYSFVDDKQQQLITPDLQAVLVQNPIASDMSAMRTGMWPGLLATMLYNQNRQVQHQKLFEQGLCFWQQGKEIQQEPYLGLLAVGDYANEQWGERARPVDFFDAKGDMEMLTELMGVEALRFEPGTHQALHPGKSADLYKGKTLVGYLGMLHPRLTKQLGLRQAPVLAQIKLDTLRSAKNIQFEKISKFPSVRRDLALLVNETISVREILQLIESKSDKLLNKAQIFDLYQGEGIEKGKKSIALGLTFQDPSRTLVDADINSAIERIIKALKEDLKATLRT